MIPYLASYSHILPLFILCIVLSQMLLHNAIDVCVCCLWSRDSMGPLASCLFNV